MVTISTVLTDKLCDYIHFCSYIEKVVRDKISDDLVLVFKITQGINSDTVSNHFKMTMRAS